MTAGCSMFEVTTCGIIWSPPHRPLSLTEDEIAQLSLSVPHDVKKISSGRALTRLATRDLASTTASLHGLPKACEELGFPKESRKGIISSATSW